jgi:5-formyltetrahydrofolate cyclo-ligase
MNDDPRTRLRRELRQRRRELPAAARIAAADALAERLLALPRRRIGFRRRLLGRRRRDRPASLATVPALRLTYCLPVLAERAALRAVATGQALTANRFGIPEPAWRQPRCWPRGHGMVVLPLVGFDAAVPAAGHGRRLV